MKKLIKLLELRITWNVFSPFIETLPGINFIEVFTARTILFINSIPVGSITILRPVIVSMVTPGDPENRQRYIA